MLTEVRTPFSRPQYVLPLTMALLTSYTVNARYAESAFGRLTTRAINRGISKWRLLLVLLDLISLLINHAALHLSILYRGYRTEQAGIVSRSCIYGQGIKQRYLYCVIHLLGSSEKRLLITPMLRILLKSVD